MMTPPPCFSSNDRLRAGSSSACSTPVPARYEEYDEDFAGGAFSSPPPIRRSPSLLRFGDHSMLGERRHQAHIAKPVPIRRGPLPVPFVGGSSSGSTSSSHVSPWKVREPEIDGRYNGASSSNGLYSTPSRPGSYVSAASIKSTNSTSTSIGSSSHRSSGGIRSTEEIALLLGGCFDDVDDIDKFSGAEVATPDRHYSPLIASTPGRPIVDVWEPNSQSNSKLIQDRILNDAAYLDTIFDSILYHVKEIIVDAFGNYLFQMIFTKCSPHQQVMLTAEIAKAIFQSSLDLRGSRCIQSMLENAQTTEVSSIIASALVRSPVMSPVSHMKVDITALCIDAHGNHVIQRSLKHMPFHMKVELINEICDNVWRIGSARFGCYVVQRCFDACQAGCEDVSTRADATQLRRHLVQCIAVHVVELAEHNFGNYCVQYIVEKGCEEDVITFVEPLKSSVCKLADLKYSSNFIEKCFDRDDVGEMKKMLLDVLLAPNVCFTLIRQQYAHFVVVHAIKALGVSPEGRMLVGNVLRVMIEHRSLQKSVRGKKVMTAVYDVFPKHTVDKILNGRA